jgi:hypothetical protein
VNRATRSYELRPSNLQPTTKRQAIPTSNHEIVVVPTSSTTAGVVVVRVKRVLNQATPILYTQTVNTHAQHIETPCFLLDAPHSASQ